MQPTNKLLTGILVAATLGFAGVPSAQAAPQKGEEEAAPQAGDKGKLPDLEIVDASFNNPVEPGASPEIELIARNSGNAVGPGTLSANNDGYMIDMVLSTDDNVPPGFTPFNEEYREDVLLRGGRISNTRDIDPGSEEIYVDAGTLPDDTPPGEYQLCFVIDPGDKVPESNEANNTFCQPLTVTEPLPDLVIELSNPRHICQHGNTLGIHTVVTNHGNAPASPFWVHQWEDGQRTMGWRNDGLQPGESSVVTAVAWRNKRYIPGTVHTFEIEVDIEGEVEESNEDNNRDEIEVVIPEPDHPCN